MNRWRIGAVVVIALAFVTPCAITVAATLNSVQGFVIGGGFGIVGAYIAFPMWEIGGYRQ